MGSGFMVLNEDCKIVELSNNAVCFLSNDGNLTIDKGHLVSRLSEDNNALREFFTNITLLSKPRNEEGLQLKLPSNPSLCFAFLTKLSKKPSAIHDKEFVVVIHESMNSCALNNDYIKKSYHLTPRESLLLRYLVTGYKLKKAATEMKVSYETARWYLKSIFNKTGTHRQTDLIQKISADAAAHSTEVT